MATGTLSREPKGSENQEESLKDSWKKKRRWSTMPPEPILHVRDHQNQAEEQAP